MMFPPPRERPLVLASTAPMLFSPLGWVMDAIADAGFEGAELLLTHNPESRDPERVMVYAQEAGLQIPVVHGPYMVLLRNVLGSSYIDKTRRSLELTAALGAETMVAHAPFRWERRARGWAGSEADAEADEYGTRFAMENLFPVAGRAFSSVIGLEELAQFDHVVFDTSHFGVAEIDLFEAWDALADRVVHMHVSDNLGTGRDSHAPIGSGILPLEAFLAHVGASGYSKTITLELDCRPYKDSRQALTTFLEDERLKVERMLAGDPTTADASR